MKSPPVPAPAAGIGAEAGQIYRRRSKRGLSLRDSLPPQQIARVQEGPHLAKKRWKDLLRLKVARVDLQLALDPRCPKLSLELLAHRLDVLGWHDRKLVRSCTHALADDVWRRGQQQEDRIARK